MAYWTLTEPLPVQEDCMGNLELWYAFLWAELLTENES